MMKNRTFVMAALILAVGSQLGASAPHVVGVLTNVQPGPETTMQVTSRESEVQSVRADQNTTYMKWILHKPLQADNRATSDSLIVGRCVSIDMRSSSGGVAKTIRISDEPSGSVFDPCTHRR